MAGNVVEITDQNFQSEVLENGEPVLVDFWVKIGKINIDDNPGAANNFGVSSIPTLMIFKGGEVVDRFVGVLPKNKLQAALDAAK
jgi:thioredoxin 1